MWRALSRCCWQARFHQGIGRRAGLGGVGRKLCSPGCRGRELSAGFAVVRLWQGCMLLQAHHLTGVLTGVLELPLLLALLLLTLLALLPAVPCAGAAF